MTWVLAGECEVLRKEDEALPTRFDIDISASDQFWYGENQHVHRYNRDTIGRETDGARIPHSEAWIRSSRTRSTERPDGSGQSGQFTEAKCFEINTDQLKVIESARYPSHEWPIHLRHIYSQHSELDEYKPDSWS